MTDAELRGRLLTVFNDRRHNNQGWVPTSEIDLSGAGPIDRQVVGKVCEELAEAGLIHWKPLTDANEGFVIGTAKISGHGADVVQGLASPKIAVVFSNKVTGQHTSQLAIARAEDGIGRLRTLIKALNALGPRLTLSFYTGSGEDIAKALLNASTQIDETVIRVFGRDTPEAKKFSAASDFLPDATGHTKESLKEHIETKIAASKDLLEEAIKSLERKIASPEGRKPSMQKTPIDEKKREAAGNSQQPAAKESPETYILVKPYKIPGIPIEIDTQKLLNRIRKMFN